MYILQCLLCLPSLTRLPAWLVCFQYQCLILLQWVCFKSLSLHLYCCLRLSSWEIMPPVVLKYIHITRSRIGTLILSHNRKGDGGSGGVLSRTLKRWIIDVLMLSSLQKMFHYTAHSGLLTAWHCTHSIPWITALQVSFSSYALFVCMLSLVLCEVLTFEADLESSVLLFIQRCCSFNTNEHWTKSNIFWSDIQMTWEKASRIFEEISIEEWTIIKTNISRKLVEC